MKKKSLLLILLMALIAPWAVAQQSLPYSYGFEDNDLSIDGWTNTDGGISNYYDEGIHSGSYYFYFSYDISEDVYLVSPSLTGGTSGVIVSFWYKALNGSYLDHFKVGYTTDATNTDPSSYTYGSLTTASTDWQQYEVTFPAGTARVAILYDEDNYDDGDYLALDDFSFTAASSCATPTDLTVNYTAGNTTATATWNSDASSFNVDVNGTVTAVNKKTYTFNVEPATSYTVKVQANCGGEVSGWASTSFFSGCAGISLPYSYGFEDAAAIDCWTVNATGNYPTYTGVSTNYPRTGTKSFRFYYTTNPPQYLISPEFSGYSNGLHVEFWYRQYSSGVETFQVGYSSTTTDDSAFTWGEEITASTTYQRFSANYPATTKYVAVKHTSDDQYYLYLDDFLFEESANCLEPTNVVASNVTTTGATLNWTAGGEETMWDIYVTDDATVVPNDGTTPTVSNTSTKPYPLTVLTPATTYYAYVRAKCGAKEASAWSSPAIFNTDCVEKDLPYSYGFEDNEFDICWSIINTNTSYCGINIMDPTGSSGNHVLAFYRGSSTGNLVAVSPEISSSYPLNGYQITFDACYANSGSGGSMTAGKLGIGIMTDPTDFTTFELIEEIDITDGYSTFGTHTVMFNSYTGSGHYIAIQDIYTQSGYVLVDNIAVTELPACIPATALGATPSSTSAELNWTANNGETSWTVYYKKSSETTYATKAATTNPYTLSPLEANTNYDYYVVANCSSTETSDPSDVYSFKTLCGSESTFPWTEDFEELTANNSIPDCWDNEDGTATGTYRWFFNTNTSGNGATNGTGHNNSKCVRFNSYNPSSGLYNCLKTVPLSLPTSTAMQLSFWYKNPAGGDLSVYLSTDGGATYTKELATGLTGASSWTEQDPINLDAYAGQDVVIVFKATSNCGYNDAYIYLDDVTVNEAPSCSAPNALGAVPSTTSAQLSWTANSGETAWTIYYKKTSESAYTDKAVTTNPYNLPGLDASTDYEYYVVANCSSTETSDPSAVYYFSTECEPFTVTATNKYTQNFESPVVTSTYNSTTGLIVPNCWDNYTDNTSTTYAIPHIIKSDAGTSGYNYSNPASQVLYLYGAGNGYAALPEFTNALNELQISFKYATEGSTQGTLTLGYITAEDNGKYNTFTAIAGASYTPNTNCYQKMYEVGPIDLSSLPATATRLVFRWYYSSWYGCNVDDVKVELIPTCKVPTGLACTDYTATTATFDWTGAGDNQTAWQLYISDKNIAPADNIDESEVINVTTKPYTVPGLTAEKTYYAWVRGNCTASSEGYSEWSEGIEFMPSAYKDFTYQEGATSSTSYVPFYGYYANNATNKGQMLIPASAFPANMVDATVRRLTFYTTSSYANVSWGDAEFDVLVTEVDATSFETAAFFEWTDMTTVYSGKLSVSDSQMVIDLDAPFSYTGGNLVIGFNLTTTGTNATAYWVANYESNCNLGAYQYGTNSVSKSSSKVKTSFNYLPSATPRPTNVHPTEELSTEATLAWTAPYTGTATGYEYQYKLATETAWSSAETTTELHATIAGLTPEKTYDFRVRAIYAGPAYSDYATTQCTTTAACAIPDGLAAANLTMNTADLTWNASTEVANYTVEYRTAAGIQVLFEEGFEDATELANWQAFGVVTTNTSSGFGQYAQAAKTGSYGFAFSSWSTASDYNQYLISPELTVTGSKLQFYYRSSSTSSSGEPFRVGYSSTGNTVDDFSWGTTYSTTSTTWDLFSDDIPAGTKYIAINYCQTGCEYRLYIDDLVIGNVVTAGSWTAATTTAPNTGAYQLTGLTAGTKYDVRVYANCTTDPDGESTTTTITTLADGTKVFNNAAGDNMWSTAGNWVPAGAPSITDNAVIRANVTIAKNYVAYAKNITRENSATITIKDGGELYHSNAVYSATMEKEIAGATTWGLNQGASDGWYVISNPLSYTSLTPTNTTYVTNLAPAAVSGVPQFDLYKYTESSMSWYSYQAHPSSYYLTRGIGFLYSRNEDAIISFMSGTSYSLPVADVTPTITYTDANGDMAGWNLLGNPFSHSITWANIEATNVNTDGYFKLGFDGAWTANPSTTAEIKPMEGFLVKATAASPTIAIKNVAASSKGRANDDFLAFTVANSNYSDITYAMFSDGEGLEKINHRNTNVPMVYIPKDGERYAIATMGDETDMFNLNFKAMTTGKYTLSYKAEGSYDYLHVIDRITGEDVDMLIDGEYSFMASAGDNENRFIVKLRYNANGNFENDIFAYQNGDEIIVNGEGELQIFDVMGRFVTSMEVNGSERISAEQYSNAVYIFRLVGNDVKTQKIVVR